MTSEASDYAGFIQQAIARFTEAGQLTLADVQEDSLLIVRLAAEITERYDTTIDIVDLFSAESIEELGQYVAESLDRQRDTHKTH